MKATIARLERENASLRNLVDHLTESVEVLMTEQENDADGIDDADEEEYNAQSLLLPPTLNLIPLPL